MWSKRYELGEIEDKVSTLQSELDRLKQEKEQLIEELKRTEYATGKIRTTMYLHGCKDSNCEKGEDLNLNEDALHNFMYALYEVKFDVEVNADNGDVKILAVDNIPLDYSKVKG